MARIVVGKKAAERIVQLGTKTVMDHTQTLPSCAPVTVPEKNGVIVGRLMEDFVQNNERNASVAVWAGNSMNQCYSPLSQKNDTIKEGTVVLVMWSSLSKQWIIINAECQ